MDLITTPPAPSGHTSEGGVLVGSDNARRRLVVFEDPQGTPAALRDGEPVDSSALYDGAALGALLRG